MATITYDSDAPGRGGSGPVFAGGSRPTKIVTGTFSFDASYPTGGEDASDIWNQFNDASGTSRLSGLLIEDPLLSAGTGKRCIVDYTNKKLLLYDNAVALAQVSNATDQSGAANLRFIAWGKR
jgi:hypothetical protein